MKDPQKRDANTVHSAAGSIASSEFFSVWVTILVAISSSPSIRWVGVHDGGHHEASAK